MIEAILAAAPVASAGISVSPRITNGFLLVGFSIVISLIYGFFFARAPAGPSKLIIKTVPVAALAVAVWMLCGTFTPALVAGLALSALGDALLAWDSKAALPSGMAAFFAAHVAYVFLFLTWATSGAGITFQLWPVIAGAALAAGAIWILRLVWAHLGALRIPVVAYAAIIVTMAVSSFLLPAGYQLVMAGAVMFMASDAILSIAIFKPQPGFAGSTGGSLAIWFLYYFGQLAIAAGFVANLPMI